jgi:hypothetical protein
MKKHAQITEYEREIIIERPEGQTEGISWERVRLRPKAVTAVATDPDVPSVRDWIIANVADRSGEFTAFGDPADTLVLIKQDPAAAIHQTMD